MKMMNEDPSTTSLSSVFYDKGTGTGSGTNTDNGTGDGVDDTCQNQNKRMTIAQKEALKRKASYSTGSRKSQRRLQKVNTSRLRRIQKIFWDGDDLYLKNSSSSSSTSDDDSDIGNGDDDNDSSTIATSSDEAVNENTTTTASNKSKRASAVSSFNFGGRMKLKKVHDSPHIYTIDNFLSETELKHFKSKIDIANRHKLFHKSFVDGYEEDGRNSGGKKRITSRIRNSIHSRSRKRNLSAREGNKGQGIQKVTNDGDRGVRVNNLISGFTFYDESKGVMMDMDMNTPQGLATFIAIARSSTPENLDSNMEGSGIKNDNSDKRTNDDVAEAVVKKQRTSTFIHFSKLSDSKIAAVENRAADLLSLPNESIEPLQLVRYERGQYFSDHHDMGILFEDGSVQLPEKGIHHPPRRLVTILVYLNDLICSDDGIDDGSGSGGATRFPLLNPFKDVRTRVNKDGNEGISYEDKDEQEEEQQKGLVIRPKKGMAVVWCNVTEDGMPDQRLVHCGEELKGDAIKYALNIWACEY